MFWLVGQEVMELNQANIYTYRVSSRIFCLGGKNSLESLTTPTFVGTLYWHVNNLGGKIEGLGGKLPPLHPPVDETLTYNIC